MTKRKKRTVKDIEKEMIELRPKKNVAYEDYLDNTGDEELANRLWGEFLEYRNRWNDLVAERKTLLKKRKNNGKNSPRNR